MTPELERGETVVLNRTTAHFAFTDPEVREQYLKIAEQSNANNIEWIVTTPKNYRAYVHLLFTPGERNHWRRQWAHRRWARRKPRWMNGRLRAR